MNAVFSSSFAFIAFLAIPALLAIYLLRNRFRIHNVSSLMLWEDQRKAHQGGLNLSRIQTPLLFFLELLTIIMLVLAAACPMIRSKKETKSFVVILDNSFSMLASDKTTARDRAVKEIRKLLEDSGDFQARFILAGKTPKLVGDPVKKTSQAIDVLKNWKCLSPVADLDKSISLGSELAGKTAHILVITDHKPDTIPDPGRIEFWAFGKSLPNLAFVNASRTSFEGRDRCFLSVANLSDEFTRSKLIVESLENQKAIIQEPIELEPHQIYRTFFEPKTGSGPLQARLEHDSLDIDNEVVLVAEPPRTLSIQLEIENETLRSAVSKAIKAVKFTRLTSNQPHLLITDVSQALLTSIDLWTVKILSEPNAISYLGPFVVDHSHPLTKGLSLEGVIWGAAKTNKFTGFPVIAAGNIPLLTDKESLTNSHNITLNFNHDFSTLLQSPNWPILLWNLIQWRKSFLPGLAQNNLILGSTATLTKDSREKNLLLIDPDNNTKDILTLTKTVLINPDGPGLYRLKTENSQYALAVNAVSKSESDLRKADTGKWGKWQEASLYWWEYRPVDWVLLLIALALITTHRFITAIQRKGAGI